MKRILAILFLITISFAGVEQLVIPKNEIVVLSAVSLKDELRVFDNPLRWKKGLLGANPKLGEVIDILTPIDTFLVREREPGLDMDWLLIEYDIQEIVIRTWIMDGLEVVQVDSSIFVPKVGWVLEHFIHKNGFDEWFIKYIDIDEELNQYNGYNFNFFGLIGLQLLWAQDSTTFESIEDKRYDYPWWRGLIAFILMIIVTVVLFSKWTYEWFPGIKKMKGKYKFMIWLGFMVGIFVCILGISVAEIAILFRR